LVEGTEFAMGVITYPGLTTSKLMEEITINDSLPFIRYIDSNAKAYPYQTEPMTKDTFDADCEKNNIVPVESLIGDVKAKQLA